ncbi:hypothetical protein XELAEV_18005644mg [Xenopus laevis]|uniref:Uncharacterized protein n=1 Tax=Xenopus laevis TaxID=8355 RepID=A0A974I3B3_XENLA|nr:hypothetical protein XELAEV_18005644mg [Xenopus laevis]
MPNKSKFSGFAFFCCFCLTFSTVKKIKELLYILRLNHWVSSLYVCINSNHLTNRTQIKLLFLLPFDLSPLN